MEKKVVVMSAHDVAAMRKANKEAQTAYFNAKVGALEFAVKEMRSTNAEYTLSELAAMTGLSPMELVVQLDRGCKAAQAAGVNRRELRWGTREVTRRFVEVLPSGEINPDSVITTVNLQRTFSIPRGR